MTARAAELRSAFEAAEDDMRRTGAVPEPFRDEAAVTAAYARWEAAHAELSAALAAPASEPGREDREAEAG
jgi:hypothetical protein